MKSNLSIDEVRKLDTIRIFWKPCNDDAMFPELRGTIWEYTKDVKYSNTFKRYKDGVFQGQISNLTYPKLIVLETLSEEQQNKILSLFPIMN